MMVEYVGRKIKYLRAKKGWTQEQLARILGVSLNTVQRWELGKTQPSPLARGKLEDVLRDVLESNQLKLFG